MSETTEGQLPFARLGDYTVLAPISEGGMASVWLGCSTEHPDRFAALKVIRPEHGRNKEFIAMFIDETRIASRLSHPNIIAIRGSGHDGQRHFLAMEVLRGRTLFEVWARAHERKMRLPYAAVAWIAARIADALHYAHELTDDDGHPLHVVHRDVSPSNIFLTCEGVPKLIDFGLAKARDRLSSTAIGVVKGKLAYLAPEGILGAAVDRRADIFALGVTLWEISLDRRLFRGETDVETVRRIRDADVPDPRTYEEEYPPALADAVRRALAKDPTKRWQTAAELRDSLDAFVRASDSPVDERTIRALIHDVFDGAVRASWEKWFDQTPPRPERIQVWDDDGQKMTWMNASVEALAGEGDAAPAVPAVEVPKTRYEILDAAIEKRLRSRDADPVTIARAWLERALIDELLASGERAAEYAQASLAACPTAAAHTMLRRIQRSRGDRKAAIAHLDAELDDVRSDAARADLLAERARLLDAVRIDPEESRAAWERVLEVRPRHAAALKGLEASLSASGADAASLADHLERMADTYLEEAFLAAWLHVEAARLFDRTLGQPDAAKASLLQALDLDRRVGPVRVACVTHAVIHRDAAWLVALLAEEALLEADQGRAARLELEAACVARQRLGDASGAITLLERASTRTPVGAEVQRRILDDLMVVYESSGRAADGLRVRRQRLTFVDDVRARSHEERGIAAIEEALGNRPGAIVAIEHAIELWPDDATLVGDLDRLLGLEALTEKRVQLWTRFAETATAGSERAARLLRAATLAASQGQMPRAVELARAALVANPDDTDIVDRLLGWLASPPAEGKALEASARIAAHAHGAEHTVDLAHRIMHLEAMALLQEQMLGDAGAASATYEAILRADRSRRTALVGLARNASRVGDHERFAQALLGEAAISTDPEKADALRVRAAEAYGPSDAERALEIVRGVLARRPGHAGARRVETELHEAAGMWAQADMSLAARIAHARDDREKIALLLARAELQNARLQARRDALESLRAVLEIDPQHPAAREALALQIEAIGDPQLLRDGLVELAATAVAPAERARCFSRAAEIEELVLSNDDGAAKLYARAREAAPLDAWLEDRYLSVHQRLARSGRAAGLRAVLSTRVDHAPADPTRAFDLACALLDDAGDVEHAAALIQGVLEVEPRAYHALRALEHAARASGSAARLLDALTRQSDAFVADGPKMGALWAQFALIESTLPDGDATSVTDRILERAPDDRAALAAAAQLAIPRVRANPGDGGARARVVAALRADLSEDSADTQRVCAHVAMGIMLESEDGIANAAERKRAALSHYREALALDARSVVAAEGAARLGAEVLDAEAVIAAALAHANLSEQPRERAAYLVQAAGQTLAARGLGTRQECLARAGEMLERALEADPEALPAVGLLVAVRTEENTGRDRLLGTLRRAFERATSRDVVENLGAEIARIAALDPPDRVLAVDALRRVLAVSPGHVAALRALAEQYAALGAWHEVVDALDQVVKTARDPRTRIAALFELAHVYGTKLGRMIEVERALRAALDIDPTSVDALRKLLKQRRADNAPSAELAGLLTRLGEAEKQPDAKAAVLTELAELLRLAGNTAGAEKALVEATAEAPNAARLTRLALLHAAPADHARALAAVVARAEELGRADAECIGELGCIEIEALNRWTDGIGHLRVALGLAPGLHRARAPLAKGLLQTHEGAEAVRALLPLMVPDASPLVSLVDPAGALAVLEGAFAADARHEEAVVARELRAIAGGLDDGAHAELRARRLSVDPAAPVPILYDAATLRANVVPADVPTLLLDVAMAIAGAAPKFARVDAEELGVSPRHRLTGHPLIVYRLARAFGLTPPDVVVSMTASRPRVVAHETPWLLVPETLLGMPEPVQAASLAGLLVRLALGVPWLEDLRGAYAHAVFCAAARQVVEGYASEVGDAETQELIAEFTRRIGRAIGRKQRKALAELAPALGASRPLVVADVEAFERALARVELRTAFLLTGDLLATIDAARLADEQLSQATSSVGKPALAATLSHPLTGDLVAFALAPAATALRRRGGSVWGRAR